MRNFILGMAAAGALLAGCEKKPTNMPSARVLLGEREIEYKGFNCYVKILTPLEEVGPKGPVNKVKEVTKPITGVGPETPKVTDMRKAYELYIGYDKADVMFVEGHGMVCYDYDGDFKVDAVSYNNQNLDAKPGLKGFTFDDMNEALKKTVEAGKDPRK